MILLKNKTKGLPRPQEVPCVPHGRLRCRTCASLRELARTSGLDRRIGHIPPEARLPQRPESPVRESFDAIELHDDH